MRSAAAVGAVVLLSACAHVSPATALVALQPAAAPVVPLTPYSDALRCIHNEIAGLPAPVKPITLTIGDVPDATGRITPGLRDMVTTAASEVAAGGRFFDLTEVGVVPEQGFLHPSVRPELGGALIGIGQVRVNSGLQLIGALTQADSNNQYINKSVGGSIDNTTLDAAKTDNISTLALDLRLVDISKGLTITNTTHSLLAVRSHDFSVNAALTIGSFGASFNYDLARQEGPDQAVRTLVELSVAELLGQAAHVPYWSCLMVNRQSPAIMEKIAGWYNTSTPAERDRQVRDHLRAAGYDVPDPPGSAADAIVDFQRRNGLIPTGRADFETYATLIAAQLPAGVSSALLPDKPPPASAITPPATGPLLNVKGENHDSAARAIRAPPHGGKV